MLVGCGFGDEIIFLRKNFNLKNKIYAQDISPEMITESAKTCRGQNVSFSISDSAHLPYKTNKFDFVIQIGGFNQFEKKKSSLKEMFRVLKNNGTIYICDEGIGPWLSKTDIFKALVNNNNLWSHLPPIKLLPENANNVSFGWILKNNFYYLKFQKKTNPKKINIDIIHKSPRGGSVRTRFEKKFQRKISY